jgi:ubiquinone/menaquinone biosynthesis C-methylase UbiE
MKRRTIEKFEFDFGFDKNAILDSLGTRYVAYLEERFVREALSGKGFIRILDVGAGTGRIMEVIAHQHNVQLVGVDLSRQMIKQARKKVKVADFVLADADALPFRSNIFDSVVAIRVLRYIPSWKHTIKEVNRVLRCSRLFVFNVSNRYSLQLLARKKGVYLSLVLRSVLSSLEENGFATIRFKSQKRFPSNIYRRINDTATLKAISLLESNMDRLIPKSLLSTDVLIQAKKLHDSA